MNLAETQDNTKKFIIIGVVLVFLYYAGKFSYLQGRGLYYRIFPKPLAEPAAEFGPLPKLTMTPVTIEGTPKYELETIDGKLRSFGDRAFVYKFVEPKASLISEQKIKELASDMGFTGTFTKTSASGFNWVDGTNNRAFQGDAVSGNFTLQTQIAKLESVLSTTSSITESDAKDMASQFLKSKGFMSNEDIDSAKITTLPILASIGRLRESKVNPQDTKLVKVDMNRVVQEKKKDGRGNEKVEKEYRVYGPNPNNALVNLMVSNDQKIYQYPLISYTYWPISTDVKDKSDYGISDISAVWQAVTEGKGIVASARPANVDYFDAVKTQKINRVSIRDIELAYYEPKEFTPYLQPIYVFSGKYWADDMQPNAEPGNIVIYYPAVRGDYVQQ